MSHDFYKLRISDLKQETSDTVSIAFEVPSELTDTYSFTPGQYLTLKANLNGEDIRRSYSICSTPSENELRVAVKRVDNGAFSTYATKELKIGDELEVMQPDGNFTIDSKLGNGSNYVFYAAGSGITPVMSMVKHLLETESDSQVFLYYGNKTKEDIIFKDKLDELNNKYSNFTLRYFLSREDSGDPIINGRIDQDKAEHFYTEELEDLKLGGVYSCGPQEMIESLEDFYRSKGLLHKYHFELFVAKPSPSTSTTAGEGVNSQVTIIIDDEEFEFELASSGSTVLQAAQNAGADVPFSCKGGVCCTCRAKVLEGSATMEMNFALEDDEVQQGFILTCQSHPTSEKLVVSYDEY